MKKETNHKKKISDKASDQLNVFSEPEAVYKKRTLKTFSSFEEANEVDAQAMAQLSPEEHLKKCNRTNPKNI